LKQESFFTILISPKGGVQTVELSEDTPDPKTVSGTVTIRNFFPGVSVTVSLRSKVVVESLPYGQSYKATGLAFERVPINLRTKLPNGTSAESGADVDLREVKNATLLIIPDSYGRFRSRIAADGKNL